eukprot:TRINITY_DN8238_c0_g1_i1.p2 TRINITY_DN8238_c0_g1~~TRINITY_DN8238_c0_g1_i1.p2  ORF type:complete len:197 (+),score=28.26 TRINITY_DN8238_c0_g1_i1:57-647(+)
MRIPCAFTVDLLLCAFLCYLAVFDCIAVPQKNVTLASAKLVSLVLARDCGTYSSTQLEADLHSVLGLPAGSARVVQFECGSIRATLQCHAATVAEADTVCTRIETEAANPASELAKRLAVAPPPEESNKLWYILFALVLLPILCYLLMYCWMRGKHRSTQESYLEDFEMDPAWRSAQTPRRPGPAAEAGPSEPQSF